MEDLELDEAVEFHYTFFARRRQPTLDAGAYGMLVEDTRGDLAIPGVDDAAELVRTREALSTLGVSDVLQRQVTIAIIM